MKKIFISLFISTLLIMSGFSQNYELTERVFKQKFDDPQLDKVGEFEWTNSKGGSFTIDETEGVVTISKAFLTWSETTLTFDTPIDLSEPNPWVTFDAKADADSLLLVVQLIDDAGTSTTTQHKAYISTGWETHGTFSFHPIWNEVNASEIKKVILSRFNKDEHSSNLYLKNFFVGTKTDFTIGKQYTLDAIFTAGGSITLDPAGENYDSNTVVTAVAVPDNGYEFVSWTGDITSTNDTIEITMDADKSITANFTLESSIRNEEFASEAKLYPNPALNILNISGIDGISKAKVTDLTGKILIEMQEENIQQIDVSELKSGIYVLTYSNKKGTLNKLFVKE